MIKYPHQFTLIAIISGKLVWALALAKSAKVYALL
jgi:hypothetical protein